MKKLSKEIILVWIVLIIGLAGCGRGISLPEGIPVENLVETQIPGFEDLGATPSNREDYFPKYLRCDQIELNKVRPGFTWRNIQIGVTTYDEMVAELENDWTNIQITLSEDTGSLQFSDFFAETTYSNVLDACFIGDVLVTLKIGHSREEFPLALSDIIKTYGKPDVVTWGHDYWNRSLIWLDLGILIVIDAEWNESNWVYLFPPIDKAEFEDSWLNQILPKSIEGWGDPELIDEIGRWSPEYEIEDLWDFTD